MIGLINYNGGNYKSVSNILEYLNIKFIEVNHKNHLSKVSHVILPGVGSYDNLVLQLKSLNLMDELYSYIIKKKILYLGICAGMQLLSNYGLENSKTKGFGLIEGVVEKIPVTTQILPNIGWHEILLEKKSNLFQNIDNNELFFYFVHSFYFNLKNQDNCTSSIYYEKKITASIEFENIYGVQFHPEKSQVGGLKLLKNFSNL
jgi:glutamine amidotransferase